MSQSTHEPLAQLDSNRQAQAPLADAGEKPSSLYPLNESNEKPIASFGNESQQHRTLHNRLLKQQRSVYWTSHTNPPKLTMGHNSTGQQTGAYVSPSDNIMSPASAKLNAYKQNRFTNRAAKPRNLFARPSALSSEGPSNLDCIDTFTTQDGKVGQDPKGSDS